MTHDDAPSDAGDRPLQVLVESGLSSFEAFLAAILGDANWLAPIGTDNRSHALPLLLNPSGA
jgi:hypothetical protein